MRRRRLNQIISDIQGQTETNNIPDVERYYTSFDTASTESMPSSSWTLSTRNPQRNYHYRFTNNGLSRENFIQQSREQLEEAVRQNGESPNTCSLENNQLSIRTHNNNLYIATLFDPSHEQRERQQLEESLLTMPTLDTTTSAGTYTSVPSQWGEVSSNPFDYPNGMPYLEIRKPTTLKELNKYYHDLDNSRKS